MIENQHSYRSLGLTNCFWLLKLSIFILLAFFCNGLWLTHSFYDCYSVGQANFFSYAVYCVFIFPILQGYDTTGILSNRLYEGKLVMGSHRGGRGEQSVPSSAPKCTRRFIPKGLYQGACRARLVFFPLVHCQWISKNPYQSFYIRATILFSQVLLCLEMRCMHSEKYVF